MLAAITAPGFQPAIFVSIQFSGGTVYVWSGYGSITWNMQTWTGLGRLLSIGQIEDGSTIEARGITLTFSGLDATLLTDALADVQLGLPVTVWLAAMSGGAPISSPVILWSGSVDQPEITVSGDTCELTINCENLLVSLNVPVDRRNDLQDEIMDWPGDLGFAFKDQNIETTIFFGTSTTTNNV